MKNVCSLLLLMFAATNVVASSHYSISVNNKTKHAVVITDQKTIKELDYVMTNVNNFAPDQETKKSEITSDGVKIQIVEMKNKFNDCTTENFSLPVTIDTVPDRQDPKTVRFVVDAVKNKKNVCTIKRLD